tara:strand:- start:96 stop:365 length:270 start_codon:yes stop_codon:yes gene_type:complete
VANSPQAKKRARQADKRREHNTAQRTKMRTYLKKAAHAITTKDQTTAPTACADAIKTLDMAASHNIIHRNKAARLKSRLVAKLKLLTEA